MTVTIIDDAYNSNPVGSKAAVEPLHMFEGMRILVTPGMVELGNRKENIIISSVHMRRGL